MPAVVTFDPVNLRIVEIDTGGDNELDLVEVYSEWKEWALLSDNLKYPQAFRYIGGDPISDVQNAGSTFFIMNGWRIRPAERNHGLQITGNLFVEGGVGVPDVPTLGSYRVSVRYFVSNLVDASVARLDLTQLNPAVYIDTTFGVAGTDEGIGTPTNPVSNIADAFAIATRDKLRQFHFRGSLVLDRDAEDWGFVGLGSSQTSTLDIGGYSVDGTRFERTTIVGSMDGRVECEQCKIDVVLGLDGVFRDCGLTSSFSVADDANIVMQRCFSEVDGTGTPVMSVGANVSISMRNYSGGIELQNVTSGCVMSVDLDPGRLVMGGAGGDGGNTGGVVVVRGISQMDIDPSVATTVVSDGLIEAGVLAGMAATVSGLVVPTAAEVADAVWDEDAADHVSAGSMGLAQTLALYDDGEGPAIHFHTLDGAAGTAVGVNGTPNNPCNNAADAKVLADTLNLTRYHLQYGLFVAPAGDYSSVSWHSSGPASQLNLSASTDNGAAEFTNIIIVGTILGAVAKRFNGCVLSNVSISGPAVCRDCLIVGDCAVSGGSSRFINCATIQSDVTAPTLSLTHALGTTSTDFRGWSGRLKLKNLVGAPRVSFYSNEGEVEVDSTCTGGSVSFFGDVGVVNTSGGTVVNHVGTSALKLLSETITDAQLAESNSVAQALATGFADLEVDVTGQKLVMRNSAGTVVQTWTLTTTGSEPITTQLGVQTRRWKPDL